MLFVPRICVCVCESFEWLPLKYPPLNLIIIFMFILNSVAKHKSIQLYAIIFMISIVMVLGRLLGRDSSTPLCTERNEANQSNIENMMEKQEKRKGRRSYERFVRWQSIATQQTVSSSVENVMRKKLHFSFVTRPRPLSRFPPAPSQRPTNNLQSMRGSSNQAEEVKQHLIYLRLVSSVAVDPAGVVCGG